MGKLGDRIGNHRLLLISPSFIVAIFISFVPKQNTPQLGFYASFGIGTGAHYLEFPALFERQPLLKGLRSLATTSLFYYLGGARANDGIEISCILATIIFTKTIFTDLMFLGSYLESI